MKRLFSTLAVAAVAVACGVGAPGARHAVEAATAPPSPPPITSTPQIGPTAPGAGTLPNPSGSRGQINIPLNPGGASPSPSPPADDRKGLDGVWEVVIQHPDADPTYDHFSLKQKGNTLTGIFLDNEHNMKKYPVAGSVDGKTVHLVVTKDDGSTLVFNGSVDGTTDMIGLMTVGTQSIAFTAAYRPKEKFIDSISPVPGGLGGIGGGSGGGGYNPPR